MTIAARHHRALRALFTSAVLCGGAQRLHIRRNAHKIRIRQP